MLNHQETCATQDAQNVRSYTASASRAKELGITEGEIQNIVHEFYVKVRNDDVLGPIFEKEMSEEWEQHLAKMCNFWSTVMFGSGLYKGNPMVAHSHIANLNKALFEHWLILFERTLTEVCPRAEHVEEFMSRAKRMATVLSSQRK